MGIAIQITEESSIRKVIVRTRDGQVVPGFAKEEELGAMDMETWRIIQGIIKGERDVTSLSPHSLIHFVKSKKKCPVIENLLATMRSEIRIEKNDGRN